MVEQSPDSLREAAPAYNDLEAKRARAGVAAALFAGLGADEPEERLKVGRYEIDSRLGAGGMGVVYRAHDPDLDRPVAVKLLHTDSSTDDKARARMLREARALAKLSHPNVITVYDVGTEDGQVFVAMELVAGRDLRRWLETSRQATWREILGLFIAAGRGLEAAHEVGLIHRDFKPENVLVGDDGRVRVLDFGLARVHQPVNAATADDSERTPSPGVARTDPEGMDPGGTRAAAHDVAHDLAHLPTTAFTGKLTETGALLGTPLYMAPELYAGRPADERSDQFAFCASLYEGVYHQLPFGSHNLPAHVKAVTEGLLVEPPADASVPAELGRIIARGLAPDSDARHRDMAALLADLDRVAQAPPLVAPAEPEPAPSRRWLGLAAVLVAVVVGLVGSELGWFAEGTSAQASVAGSRSPTPAMPDTDRVESASPALDSDPGPQAETGPAELVSDHGQADSSDATDTTGDTSESSGSDGSAAVEPTSPSGTNSELHGWCHLHEDRYTLLSRTNSRRGSLMHQGACYICRVEQRRSRTSSFSPRDCAGYSLCGEASADACE